MRRFVNLSAVLAVPLLLAQTPWAVAGGPYLFSNQGAIGWDPQVPVKYKVDLGDLGPIDAATIQASIKEAFKAWSDVPTSTIEFQFDGLLDDDVVNFADYLIATENETGGNVVILDDDGDIVAEAFGEENRNQILGFALPVAPGDEITAFFSLMNGRLAFDAETFLSTLIHEFGHSIGLDHTQINAEFAGDGNKPNDANIPTMFPTSSDDDVQLGTLNPDDIAWVSMLYPTPDFKAKFGRIRGRLVRAGGSGGNTPVLGANVVAIEQSANNAKKRLNRYSCVTDWLGAGDGEFVIPVPPGTYRLIIEPIRSGFTGGSGIGPHSIEPTSPSFVNPILPFDHGSDLSVTAGNQTDAGTISAD